MKDRKVQLRVLYAATCMMWFAIYFYVPILSPYSASLGANYKLVGTILGSYGLTQLILRLPAGIWSDRANKRKPFLVAGMVAATISGIGFFFTKDPALLPVFRALAGVAASTWAIYMISYNSYYSAEQQSKSMGIISTSMYIGQMLGTFLGGVVAQFFGERWTFFVSALAGLVGVVLLLQMPEPPSIQRKVPRAKDFLRLLLDRNLVFFSLMAVVMQIANYTGVLGFVPNVLRDMGASNFLLGLCTTLGALPAVFTSYLSGSFFEKRFGTKATLGGAFILFALSLIGMVAAKSVGFVLFLAFLSGAAKGILQPLLNARAIADAPPEVRSAAASFFQSVYGIGMTAGPVVAGAIADAAGMNTAFLAVGIFTLLPALLIALWRIRPKADDADGVLPSGEGE